MNINTGEIKEYNQSMDKDPDWIKVPDKYQAEANDLKNRGKSAFESKNLSNLIYKTKANTCEKLLKKEENFIDKTPSSTSQNLKQFKNKIKKRRVKNKLAKKSRCLNKK